MNDSDVNIDINMEDEAQETAAPETQQPVQQQQQPALSPEVVAALRAYQLGVQQAMAYAQPQVQQPVQPQRDPLEELRAEYARLEEEAQRLQSEYQYGSSEAGQKMNETLRKLDDLKARIIKEETKREFLSDPNVQRAIMAPKVESWLQSAVDNASEYYRNIDDEFPTYEKEFRELFAWAVRGEPRIMEDENLYRTAVHTARVNALAVVRDRQRQKRGAVPLAASGGFAAADVTAPPKSRRTLPEEAKKLGFSSVEEYEKFTASEAPL